MRNRPMPGAPKPEIRPGVRPSAVAVDLHYLLWAHGVSPAVQQSVVGWALRRLSDRPSLTNEKLNHGGGAVFKPTEDVALLVEDLPLPDLLALSNRWAPSRQSTDPRARIHLGSDPGPGVPARFSPESRQAMPAPSIRRGALVCAGLQPENVIDTRETGGGGHRAAECERTALRHSNSTARRRRHLAQRVREHRTWQDVGAPPPMFTEPGTESTNLNPPACGRRSGGHGAPIPVARPLAA
jgi:hypothetical protein